MRYSQPKNFIPWASALQGPMEFLSVVFDLFLLPLGIIDANKQWFSTAKGHGIVGE